ncbi:MAG: flavodoxin-dependent (E)-4-hydroxy-3-methylbut-2-enyl-diphosphate synthase [Lentisphaerae bacterium]|nr:flavodoxin-dependent (E)-4-hydroxy-3-methylbut-2-enyl-diphosphate synthase [Lentisphaerota bacterium]
MTAARRATRRIRVGRVAVGGGAPVSVQTMLKTDTRDVAACVTEIRRVETLGCDIVRLAVPDEAAARAIGAIRAEVGMPLVADVHFDYRLAIASVEAGADGLRINPGNIGGPDRVAEVVRAAKERNVPIRVGVNSGSLEKEMEELHGRESAEALVGSAMKHVRLIEDLGYDAVKISVKSSDVRRTIEAYELLAARTDCPLHLGLTEAGTFMAGTVRSCAALGALLADGIGDTIRISLTDTPSQEVLVGLELLRALGLRAPGPHVVACPTCGRAQVDVADVAAAVERELDAHYRAHPDAARPRVAVMGCMVNGPGEARDADIAVAGGKGKFALYVRGEPVATIAEAEAASAIMERVRAWRG